MAYTVSFEFRNRYALNKIILVMRKDLSSLLFLRIIVNVIITLHNRNDMKNIGYRKVTEDKGFLNVSAYTIIMRI
jgi:hypothetical protein